MNSALDLKISNYCDGLLGRQLWANGSNFHSGLADGWQVIAFGFCFSICYGTTKGLGLHEHDVRQEWQADLNRSIYTFSVLYVRAKPPRSDSGPRIVDRVLFF